MAGVDPGSLVRPEPEARAGSCVACREPIREGASLCPHCQSPQRPDRWSQVAGFLKWVGGITAVASLVATLYQVQTFLSAWRERHVAVEELVRAARLEADSGDYAGSFSLYQEALQIEQESRAARDGQLQTAMKWLRDIRVTGSETFTAAVEKLLPILYRGAAKEQPQLSADALAHIGWADYLRTREGRDGLDVERSFREAERRDPDNPYAHAMEGFWILFRHGDAAEARRHFALALHSGREASYVRSLQVWALVNDDTLGSRIELVQVLNQMRKSGYPLDAGARRRAYETVYRAGESRKLLEGCAAVVPAPEQLATLEWAHQEGAGFARDYQFYRARLMEAAGDPAGAAPLYRALQKELLEEDQRRQVSEGLARIAREPGR